MSKLGGDFWKLWAAVAGSNAGNGIRVAALPLLATTLTTNAVAIGAIAAATWLPWLLFAMPAGGFADRHDRRTLMRNLQLIRLGLVTALAVSIITDRLDIGILLVVAFALGALDVVYNTTAEALLPSFVRREQLVVANGRIFAAELVANRMVGPLVGAALFAFGGFLPFAADGVLLVLAAVCLQLLPSRALPGRPAGKPADRGLLADVRDGIRWLVGSPLLRGLSVGVAILNLALGATGAMMVVLALDELRAGSTGYGLLLASGAVGGLAGTTTVGRIDRWLGDRKAIIITMLLSGVIFGLVGAAPNLWLACVLMAASGFCGATGNILVRSLRQTLAPDEMRGRVSAGFRFVSYSTLPAGSFLGGLLSAATGVRWTFVAAGAIVCLAAAAVAHSALQRPEPVVTGERSQDAGA